MTLAVGIDPAIVVPEGSVEPGLVITDTKAVGTDPGRGPVLDKIADDKGGMAFVIGGTAGGMADDIGGIADDIGGIADDIGGIVDDIGGIADDIGGTAGLAGTPLNNGGIAEDIGDIAGVIFVMGATEGIAPINELDIGLDTLTSEPIKLADEEFDMEPMRVPSIGLTPDIKSGMFAGGISSKRD